MDLRRRLFVTSAAILVVFAGGVVGFYVLGRIAGGAPTVLECAYQTLIFLSTLGSREMQPLCSLWYGQLFVLVLVLVGMGVLALFVTNLTAFVVEGEAHNLFGRKKMEKLLAKLNQHYVVCGAGDTGHYVIEELLRTGHPLVVVDTEESHIQRILEGHPKAQLPYVVGRATDDQVLQKVGLERAKGIVVTLPDERDNLFITVTARQTNPKLRIVVRASEPQTEQRLRRAGADAVVSPNRIGGMRLASEMIRPQVVGFLDHMLKEHDKTHRIEEIVLSPSGPLSGKTLAQADLKKNSDLLVLAVRDPDSADYIYGPPPGHVLKANATLIVLGSADAVHSVRSRLS